MTKQAWIAAHRRTQTKLRHCLIDSETSGIVHTICHINQTLDCFYELVQSLRKNPSAPNAIRHCLNLSIWLLVGSNKHDWFETRIAYAFDSQQILRRTFAISFCNVFPASFSLWKKKMPSKVEWAMKNHALNGQPHMSKACKRLIKRKQLRIWQHSEKCSWFANIFVSILWESSLQEKKCSLSKNPLWTFFAWLAMSKRFSLLRKFLYFDIARKNWVEKNACK